ncbi:MAG: hypothetical protein HQ453_01465 [Actinobacteria bacterium]|nr:hypothetical protein [Actinomycetota bacterium]
MTALGHVRIPKAFNPRNPQSRRDLASAMREVVGDASVGRRSRQSDTADDAEIALLRMQLRQHPCHGCADREQHARWAERYMRARREMHDLEQRVEGRTNSIARRFDRVTEVLADLGYLTSAGDDAEVTEAGRTLMRLYTESDLLAAQCVREGVWDGLLAADLAAACAALVYESRSNDDGEAPRLPKGPVRDVLTAMGEVREEVHEAEARRGLEITRPLDLGFVWATHRWASGAPLLSVLSTGDLTAGDFVRWTRQVIDLLGQVAQAVPAGSPLRSHAHEAADRLNRGVVSYSSTV